MDTTETTIEQDQLTNKTTDNKPERTRKPRFGEVSITRAKGTTVYEQRGGGRSTKTVECSIPIPGAGIAVDATIYARFNKPGDPVTFAASLPKGVSGLSDNDEEQLLAHAENAAVKWAGWKAAQSAAWERLTGIAAANKPAEAQRPRLVYHDKRSA